MTKIALGVILVGSTLLFSAACPLAAGQAASPTPTVTWPATNWPKGIPTRVGLDEQTSPSTAVAEAETLYADLADSYGVISTIDSGLFATYRGKVRQADRSIQMLMHRHRAARQAGSPTHRLSHPAWKSRKVRGIPTFPQPRRLLDQLKPDKSRAKKTGHLDVSAALFDEAFADVPAWNTYEPAWQRKYLGRL